MHNNMGKERLDRDRKIVALIVFGAICALLLILLVNLSVNTSSGIRAYVSGEGNWAKAQKEAVIHLTNYVHLEDEYEFESFKSVLRVNLGDKVAREELLKDDYDYEVAFEGFLQGKNHPEDIPHMINLFRRFYWVDPVEEAISVWGQGDEKIQELIQFSDSIHQALEAKLVSLEQKREWAGKLEDYDHQLTDLEVQFSNAMGDMARLVNIIFRWSTITLGFLLIGIGGWLFSRFLRSTDLWAKTLRESEEKFKNVLANSRDVLYKMNLNTKKYDYVSPALKNMLGYDAKEFLEGGLDFILSKMHPEDKERMNKVVERYGSLDKDDFLPQVEFRLKTTDGNWKWVSNVRTLVRDKQGSPEAIVGSVRDISKRKDQEEQLKKSLKDKEILLQEIHHRIKNSLSIITSLLELQKNGVSEEVQNLLSSSQSRIKSIAKVHEKLYKSTTLSEISMDVYITELSEEIAKTYASEHQNIDMQVEIDPFSMNIDKAVPCGLVLNELINNAYKHAFEESEDGMIRILLKKKEEGMELVVENNGEKLPDDFDPSQSDSLGMTLIRVLIKRFNGKLEIESKDWVRFKIYFDTKNGDT